MTPGLWLRAATRFEVDVAPGGTTVVALRAGLAPEITGVR
jgi:hypothetical protein